MTIIIFNHLLIEIIKKKETCNVHIKTNLIRSPMIMFSLILVKIYCQRLALKSRHSHPNLLSPLQFLIFWFVWAIAFKCKMEEWTRIVYPYPFNVVPIWVSHDLWSTKTSRTCFPLRNVSAPRTPTHFYVNEAQKGLGLEVYCFRKRYHSLITNQSPCNIGEKISHKRQT